MSTYRDIHHALTTSFVALNAGTLGSVPVAYEGQVFDPTTVLGDVFINESYIFNQQESLSKTTLDEVTGIYQLSVYQKSGLGVADVLDLVDAIINEYQHNATFAYNGQNVVVVNSGRNNGRDVDGWYIVDISINFKSDKPRGI